jgi:hypothetical protein
MVPVPWNYSEDRPAKTIDQHLKKVPAQISESWGNKPIFIDFNWLDITTELENRKSPIRHLFDEGQKHKLGLIPVTSPSREEPYKEEIKKLLSSRERELCLRLENDDFLEDLNAILEAELEFYDVQASKTHLLIDFGGISESQKSAIILAVIQIIRSLPNIDKWKSLILAATAFPENLSGVDAGTQTIPRTEWDIWKEVFQRKDIPRTPDFGDYSIANPNLIEVDPRIMTMSANIRYTSEDEWFIFKARNVRKHGYDQFFDLAKSVVEQKCYCGRDFSWGDEYIAKCAKKEVGPGNATTWRKVGNSHHLTFVAHQLANYSLAL